MHVHTHTHVGMCSMVFVVQVHKNQLRQKEVELSELQRQMVAKVSWGGVLLQHFVRFKPELH